MSPIVVILLASWIALNVALVVALARAARDHRDRASSRPARARRYAAPVDGYGALLVSRVLLQTARVAGAREACLLLRDPRRPDTLVPVAVRGLDEGVIGRRIAVAGDGYTVELTGADGEQLDGGRGTAVPVVRDTIGECGYLWAAAGPGAELGDGQIRLLGELARACARALGDVDDPAALDEAIGRALALVTEGADPAGTGRHAALVRAVGERLGLDDVALIELDMAARVQHVAPVAPAAAVRALPGFGAVAIVLRFAGERWDGRGPGGLRAERIPLASRVLAVCQALGMPSDSTLREIQGASGREFDPAVVTALSHELLGPLPELDQVTAGWAAGDRLFAGI